ncbi:MAG: UDP-glucose 4-epimerase GalE [Defluviitaleaceae bacterium]|nr:UDP-glucose 4-epimerase GalE [Defluviitaleaceae bacterium]
MTILITGIAGYIGSHAAVELLNANHDIIGIDNYHNADYNPILGIRQLTGKNFAFYAMDAGEISPLDKIFARHKIDCIMHFAGFKAVGESVASPLEYYSNNLNLTINLCKMMDKYGVKKFIFSSSATVYRMLGVEMPLHEQSELGECTNPYGWTKFMSERILMDTAAARPDWSVALLRYANPVGAHESGIIGENPSGIPNNLMPYIAQTAAGVRDFLPVFGDDYDTPDGTCIRDYIHITDLAKGHLAALDYCNENNGAFAFNLGTGRGNSVLEMIQAFERATNIKIPYKIMPRRAGDAPVSYLDSTKARKVLNWQAEKNMEDVCADLWHFQQMQKRD